MTNVIKPIVFFGCISIGIDLIRTLIFTKFDITRFFTLDFFLFEIGLEFVMLIITAFVTNVLLKKNSKDNLGTSLTKALIFGIIYGAISLLFSRTMTLIMGAGIGFQFNIYDSFVKYIPNGFTQGVLFTLVMHHLLPKNSIVDSEDSPK